MLETLFLSLNYEKSECINLKNCALGGSIILSTGGSIFVSAEAYRGYSRQVHSPLSFFCCVGVRV
jgi:hypothetical protein